MSKDYIINIARESCDMSILEYRELLSSKEGFELYQMELLDIWIDDNCVEFDDVIDVLKWKHKTDKPTYQQYFDIMLDYDQSCLLLPSYNDYYLIDSLVQPMTLSESSCRIMADIIKNNARLSEQLYYWLILRKLNEFSERFIIDYFMKNPSFTDVLDAYIYYNNDECDIYTYSGNNKRKKSYIRTGLRPSLTEFSTFMKEYEELVKWDTVTEYMNIEVCDNGCTYKYIIYDYENCKKIKLF
jgi:fluoride ion exporter CrcB/FEX